MSWSQVLTQRRSRQCSTSQFVQPYLLGSAITSVQVRQIDSN